MSIWVLLVNIVPEHAGGIRYILGLQMFQCQGYGLGELYVTPLAQAGRDHLAVQDA